MTKERLIQISPDRIRSNPDNPRMYFRPNELDQLMASIDRHGIQVPITVFSQGNHYVLIDGERRWRCSRKLGLKAIPAIIKDKPSPLQNLLLMYNIHALREQWDYLTIATSLERVIDLYQEERSIRPTEKELSKATGLTIAQVRRCRLIIDLPRKYKNILKRELHLPKNQQALSEDFFLEMEKSLRAVTRSFPSYKDNLNDVRDTLIDKYKSKTITAVTEFRQLTKIATAVKSLAVDQKDARKALEKIFNRENDVGIKKIFEATVGFEYDERKASLYTEHLTLILQGWIEEGLDDKVWDKNLEKKLRDLLDNLVILLEEGGK